MTEQLKNIQDSSERLDRFYIGYMRSRTKELLNSDVLKKREVLRNALSESELGNIHTRYPYNYLPIYARIYYWLMKNGEVNLLVLYEYVTSFLFKYTRR